ncbi:MAG TPA: hypothetical protein VGF13_16875, partial [Verrucomicrobiae bacterium]|jgi:hypothetical protein
MTDAIQVVWAGGGPAQLRDLLPQWFNWPLFLAAWTLMAVPVVEVLFHASRKKAFLRLASTS